MLATIHKPLQHSQKISGTLPRPLGNSGPSPREWTRKKNLEIYLAHNSSITITMLKMTNQRQSSPSKQK